MKPTIQRLFLRTAAILFCAIAWPAVTHAGPVSIALVPVGDPGNTADTAVMTDDGTTGYGSVSYSYNIGKYDVTNSQYSAFLNAVDPTGANSLRLYSTAMKFGTQGGISWDGSSYIVNPGYANQPVTYASWNSAARFCNWLSNGQGSGGTETGVYNFTGLSTLATTPSDHSALIGTGTKYFLPTEDEWYKAAYYKGGGTNAGYWRYPFQSDTQPNQNMIPGGSNSGNFYNNKLAVTQMSAFDSALDYLTDVGTYTSAVSPYGSYDMGGDVFQWNETLLASSRGTRGGAWPNIAQAMAATERSAAIPSNNSRELSFRVAELPEPGSLTLFIFGAIGLLALAWRRSHPRRPAMRS